MEIIAEIGQAHDGSYGNLLCLVDAICDADVTTIKLQHHIAEAESSQQEQFRVHFSKQDSSRQEYWNRVQLPIEILSEAKHIAEKKGKRFLCTPFSMAAVDDLMQIGVERIKIGSADLSNLPLLRYIGECGKPVILSNGLRSDEALDEAVNMLSNSIKDITIFHCTSLYPTPLQNVNLDQMDILRQRYGLPTGLSDHSGLIWPSIFALHAGAVGIEVHVCWDKRQFGPDTSSSIDFEDLGQLCAGADALRQMNVEADPENLTTTLQQTAVTFSRSAKLRKDKKAGQTLELGDIEMFKPGGLSASPKEVLSFLGLIFIEDREAGSIITGAEFEK